MGDARLMLARPKVAPLRNRTFGTLWKP